MADGVTRVVLAPAAGVTDLDEWYGRLDATLSMRDDSRWGCTHGVLSAELPAGEADEVLSRARAALGDAVDARRDDGPTVLVADAAGGRPIDE